MSKSKPTVLFVAALGFLVAGRAEIPPETETWGGLYCDSRLVFVWGLDIRADYPESIKLYNNFLRYLQRR